MNTYWPTKFDDNNGFWAHEWNKHGTCVTTLSSECFSQNSAYKPGMEVNNYFKQGLKLRQQFNLYSALKKNGVVATLDKSQWKTPSEISNIIQKEFGVGVQLKCQSGLIYEVVMYFAAQGKDSYVPMALPSNLQHSCGKSGSKVGLPPKNLSAMQLEFLKNTIGYDLEAISRKDDI
jgi:ribonuclease T2